MHQRPYIAKSLKKHHLGSADPFGYHIDIRLSRYFRACQLGLLTLNQQAKGALQGRGSK